MMMSNEKDIGRLNLLGIFHYVLGIFLTLFACLLLYVGVRKMFMSTGVVNPEKVTYTIKNIKVFAILILSIWWPAIYLFISGLNLKRCKNRESSVAIARMECVMAMIFVVFLFFGGYYHTPLLLLFLTQIFILLSALLFALGISTLIMLNKKSVKELYQNLRESA